MKKNKILTLLLLLIIALSILYFTNKFNQNNKNSFRYNNFNVYQTAPTVYVIEIYLKNDKNPHYISIRYDPRDLDYIEVEPNLREKILKNNVFITLTPELTSNSVVALAEISKIIGNQFLFNIPTSSAITYEKENIPRVTCEDATTKSAVILLKLSDQTKVYSEEECIIIEGKTEEEIIKASTKFILSILKISK